MSVTTRDFSQTGLFDILTCARRLEVAVKAALSCPVVGAAPLLTMFKCADSCLKWGFLGA